MNILLKGLTEQQAKVLTNYFEKNLYPDSEIWIDEYCEDIQGIEVDNVKEKEDVIEINLITFEK